MKSISLMFTIGFAAWGVLLPMVRVDAAEYDHQQDIVYGYKDGMALVMDVFSPKGKQNGAGIIQVVSGGMNSSPIRSHRVGRHASTQLLLNAGYVVFAVAHSSQPKYAIDEISRDIPRAVRFIRHHAKRFGIDPQRIGIKGGSSGGHLSLMAAAAPPAPAPEAEDPIDHESSQVQAVVVHFPGTDLLNFGRANRTALEFFHTVGYKADAHFDFRRWNEETKLFERVSDAAMHRKLLRENSPITHVSPNTPPVLLFHGDKDQLVPFQQSQLLVAKLRKVGVEHKLIVAKGEGHGWPKTENERTEMLSWFGRYLLESEE